MKVALLFSGNVRNFKDTHRSFFHYFIKDNDCDVFIHTWNTKDSNTSSWWRKEKKSRKFSLEDLCKIYRPKAIEVEDYLDSFQSKRFKNVFLHNLMSMQYGIKSVFGLFDSYRKKTGAEYDIVVRVRFDLIFKSIFNNNEFYDCINSNSVYLPKSMTYKVLNGVSDVFAFGPPCLMEKYCNFFDNLIDNSGLCSEDGGVIVPEFLLDDYLKNNSVNVQYTEMEVGVLRSSTNIVNINYSKSSRDFLYPFFLVKTEFNIDFLRSTLGSRIIHLNDLYVRNNCDGLLSLINFQIEPCINSNSVENLRRLRSVYFNIKHLLCRRCISDIKVLLKRTLDDLSVLQISYLVFINLWIVNIYVVGWFLFFHESFRNFIFICKCRFFANNKIKVL
jgi:hypothetical protein